MIFVDKYVIFCIFYGNKVCDFGVIFLTHALMGDKEKEKIKVLLGFIDMEKALVSQSFFHHAR